jgi:serine/threonine-protein kinase HipA
LKDPKAVSHLDVFRDRLRVGTLTRTQDGSLFRYTDEFLASETGTIALHLPKNPLGVEARGTTNLPAFFAGLLPEGIMQDAVVRAYRLSRDDLFSQLALTGSDAVGDVTVAPPEEEPSARIATPQDAKRAIEELFHGGRPGGWSTVSGVQPKLSIGEAVRMARGRAAIVKLEPPQYPGLLANEAYFMRLARQTGLRTAKVRLETDLLVVERFDRIPRKGFPSSQVHVEDALQVLDRYPLAKYSLDYTEILDAAVRLRVAKAVLLDLLRLYALSYVIGNGDLHAKNVSFAYRPDAGQWRMTSAYDLVCTLPFESDSRMALPLDEQFGAFEPEDFRRVGTRYGVPERAIGSMLRKIAAGTHETIRTVAPPIPAQVEEEILARATRLGSA